MCEQISYWPQQVVGPLGPPTGWSPGQMPQSSPTPLEALSIEAKPTMYIVQQSVCD